MINFVYESGGYSAVKEIIMDHETAITNLGYSSTEEFMTAYYHYIDVRFLKIEDADYFTNYDTFITKLNDT